MKVRNRIFALLGLIAVVAVVYYFLTTERNQGLTLIGTVDANQVIVSAKIAGRIEKLLVTEGTAVKEGDVVAVLDSAELEAQKRAAAAMLASLRSQVSASQANETVTQGSTTSDVTNAQAKVRASQAQLAQSQADLDRLSLDAQRTVSLAAQGIASQQDRDHAGGGVWRGEAAGRSGAVREA